MGGGARGPFLWVGLMGAVAARRRPSSALLSLLKNTPVTGVGGDGRVLPRTIAKTYTQLSWVVSVGIR